MTVLVYPRCARLMTQQSCFLVFSGRQALLPPSQPPHSCHQVSTSPFLFTPVPSYANVSALQVHKCIFMQGLRSPCFNLFCNDWTNCASTRSDRTTSSFSLTSCRFILFSAGWICQGFMTFYKKKLLGTHIFWAFSSGLVKLRLMSYSRSFIQRRCNKKYNLLCNYLNFPLALPLFMLIHFLLRLHK